MKKYIRLIICMTVSIIISSIIIWLLKGEYIRVNNAETVANIFIGILGSSIVALIGYFLELHFEKRKVIKD